MKYSAMHSMSLGLTGELYSREKCCIDGEQNQWGIIEHSVACQGLFKSLTSSTVTCLPMFGRESYQHQASRWNQSCLCFTGCHYVCSVITETTTLKHSDVYAIFRLGIEMLGGKKVPKETCALCQLVTSLHIVWIIHDLCMLQFHGYYKRSTYPSLWDFNESIMHHITYN